ncbi:MAG TPA: DUF421 domain-containing protein [Pseudoneobacillus sp.]|nr:DUF421 domain-containing protein [Pseudoneobacillus sp.]
MQIPVLLLRLALSFITLLVLTRLMGRKEISQMTFFNFISAISIGTIGASLAIDPTLSIRNGLIALVAWSVFTLALGFLDIKSRKVRKLIVGEPIIIIKQGKIMEDELQKVRLDIDSLKSMLRKKNIFSLSDVDYAIFETDGTISVLKQEAKQTITRSDMNMNPSNTKKFPISTEVVSEGKIITKNLEKLNLSKDWLEKQLQLSGINSVSDVFYAEVLKNGTLYIDNRNDM